jgi:ubiquinone/menaquinone biosynthesis C-methylase UbiE
MCYCLALNRTGQMTDITKDVFEYWDRQSCGTDRTTAPKHSDRYFAEIDETRYRLEPGIKPFAQFNKYAGKHGLEVGYGAGADFAQFVKAGAIMSGMDLTNEAAENLSNRLRVENLPECDIRVGSAEALPFSSNSFDFVYSWGVIHHANDTPKCLSEIARVAKPGADIKIMFYNVNSVFAWGIALQRRIPNRRRAIWDGVESVGTKCYTEPEVRQMFAKFGLPIRSITYSETVVQPGSRFYAIRRLLQKILPVSTQWYMQIDAYKP